MPKPRLKRDDELLENDIISTLLAGLKQWRSDLDYPESHSDMQACVRGLLCMYKIERLPLPKPLELLCESCEGLGKLITEVQGSSSKSKTCPTCMGKKILIGR